MKEKKKKKSIADNDDQSLFTPCREEKGLVIKNTGNNYLVKTNAGEELYCQAKGNFRLKGIRSTSPVVVGDHVILCVNDDNSAYITDIEERKNYILRRASNLSKHSHILAANIDLALLIVTIKEPITSTVFIDRFLVTAEAYRVPVCLVFNKIDLYDELDYSYLNGLTHLYKTIGYSTLKISTKTGEGLDEVRQLVKGKTTLISGHSGVGKSSLINEIVEESSRKVGKISEYHQKGMHTTTFSEMIPLKEGGYIVDTPGIKGFGIIDMEKSEIAHYFPEIFRFSHQCRYNNCLHLNDPGCAVIKGVDENYISQSRYSSYLNILEDLEEGKYRS